MNKLYGLLFALGLLIVSVFFAHSFDIFRACSGATCPETDPYLAWPSPLQQAVSYKIDSTPVDGTDDLATEEEAISEIKASFQAWEDSAQGTINLQFDQLIDSGTANGENISNEVFYIDSGWASQSGQSSGVIALTTVSFNESGDILDADMQLNGENYVWDAVSSEQICLAEAEVSGDIIVDIRNVVTHEAGHFIGIDHSCDDSAATTGIPNCNDESLAAATMAATATTCETLKRSLASDDISAVQFLYPSSGVKPGASVSTGGDDSVGISSDDNGGGCSCAIGPGSQNGKGTSLFLLAFIPLGFILWLKRQFLM